jgi:hypothetical protein
MACYAYDTNYYHYYHDYCCYYYYYHDYCCYYSYYYYYYYYYLSFTQQCHCVFHTKKPKPWHL